MNNLLQLFRCYALAIILWGIHVNMAMAQNAPLAQNARPTLQWALDNPNAITPDILKNPENAHLLLELKALALAKHQRDAVAPLVKLGDKDVLQDCVALYHMREVRFGSIRVLARSANPDVILLLGEDLNRGEVANNLEMRGDIMLVPISVQSAEIIKDIIGDSSVFPPASRAWAKSLPPLGEELRQPMKVWWNQNKTLLQEKRFSEVQPPR